MDGTPMAKGSMFTFLTKMTQECQLSQVHFSRSFYDIWRKEMHSYLVHFSVSLCYYIHHLRYCHRPDHDIPLWYWIRTMTILTFLINELFGSQRVLLLLRAPFSNYFTFGVCWGCFTLCSISLCRWRLLVWSRDPLIGVSFDFLHTIYISFAFLFN